MSDDPLQKMIAALIRQGATEADLDAYTQDYEHQHRFKDPTLAATTAQGEAILPGPRTEERSYGGDVLHRTGQLASGAMKALPYLATAPAEGAAFLYEMAKSGVMPTRDPAVALREGMHNNPVRKAAEGVNDAVAGAADKIFGGPEDTRDKALQFGGGLVGIPAGMEAAAATLPKAGRLVGITTKAGRAGTAAEMLSSANARAGQTGSDVAARIESMARPDGSTPSLAEGMGPGADMALGRLAPLGDKAAGRASAFARTVPGTDLEKSLAAAAARRETGVSMPQYPTLFGAAKKAVGVGLRRSKRMESEEALNQLLAPAEGRQGPLPDITRPPPSGPAPSTQSLEGDGPSIAELLAERQTSKNPNMLTNTFDDPRKGRSAAWLAKRNEKLGIQFPKPEPVSAPVAAEPEMTPEQYHALTRDPDNLEAMLKATADFQKQYGRMPMEDADPRRLLGNERGSLGVRDAQPSPFPDRVSNPQDPYAEITQSTGPETPELARVKLLRKTLGMKGQGGLEMLLGSGAASGGLLTAALAALAAKKHRP